MSYAETAIADHSTSPESALNIPCLASCPSNSSGSEQNTSELKAFGDRKFFWKTRELSIRFLDGDEALQKRVAKVSKEWTNYANITFNFNNQTNADIRISFAGVGHWSVLGTDAKNVPLARPTMNLQITTHTTEDEVGRVTLHEFGHALGLIHEHRQPGNRIKWNKPVVLKWYEGPPNNWTQTMIEEQVFKPYNTSTTVANGYHPDSIMHYPILKGWTTDGFTVDWNKKLADSDKQFVERWYPKKP